MNSASSFVYVPENLNLDGLLMSQPRRIAEGVLWLGHCVFVQLAMNAQCRDNGNRVPLKASYLRNIIGRHHLGVVRETAESIGYVKRDASYRAGQRSQKYWIREPYSNVPLVRREIADPKLRCRIESWQEQRRRESWERIRSNATPVSPEVSEHLWQHLQRIRVDEHIDFGDHDKSVHHIGVDYIRCRDFRFVVDDYGRIHTNVTNLRRTLRRHISVDGERLVNVDIAESQPLFVGLALADQQARENGTGPANAYMMVSTMMDNTMMDKTASPSDHFGRDRLPQDLRDYLALCERRCLYQFVADCLEVPRSEAKRRVMVVFFDRPWHRNVVSDALEQRFPTVMAAMRGIKRQDYRRLAHFAQRIESRFMYGRIVPRLMRERPELFVTTIHDSVLTTTREGVYVRRVMLEEFASFGVTPSVRVEPA